MDRRTIFAVFLIVFIMAAYQFYLAKTPTPPPAQAPQEASRPAKIEEERETELLNQRPLPSKPMEEEEITVETDLLKAVISTRGGQIKSWRLKRYLDAHGMPLEMVPQEGIGQDASFLRTWSKARDGHAVVYRAEPQQLLLSPSQPKGTLTLHFKGAGGLDLTKSLVFYNDDYRIDLETRGKNMSRQEQALTFDLLWGPGIREGKGKGAKTLKPPTSLVNGGRIEDKWEKLERPAEHQGEVSWTAIHDNYFCAALIPLGKGAGVRVEKIQEEGPRVSLYFPQRRLSPGQTTTENFSLYVGPKEIDRLTRLGFGLREIIDLGWFGILARPALYFLKYINSYLHNYGLAIILLTFLVRIILFPLTQKSFKSMQEMQKLQPKINMLRERFKEDSKRMNQELMELYRKHNINPMGGCLPMVLQIPIFIALYNALINSVELWRSPFVLWIKDLSAKDPYYVLPVLMGISWVVQQWMTPTTGDPRQAKLMLLMPVVFTFMFLNFPSGLVLYFLVSNLLGIAQQYYMNVQLKVPSKADGKA